jgi:hypothetical protein
MKARVVVRHARHLVAAETVGRLVAVGAAKAVRAVQLELRRHLNDRRVGDRRDERAAEDRGDEVALVDRAAVGHAQIGVVEHRPGAHVGARRARRVRGPGQHDVAHHVLAHRTAGEVASEQAPDLGDDLVRLVVRDAEAAVALQI